MKRLVLLTLLASACHINDITFTPLGDDGVDDANGDSPIKLIDAPPNLPPQTRGFVAMQGAGYSVLHKAPNGDLTPAQTALPVAGNGMAMAIATNRAGTHVYVGVESAVAGSQLMDVAFNDVVPGAVMTKPLPCGPRRIVVHPSQSNLVVTCSSQQSFTYALDANGTIVGTAVQLPGGGNSPKVPAFSPDGACLYLADPNSGGMRISGLSYNSAGNIYTSATAVPGPTGAADLLMHPNGTLLYLITDTVVQQYTISAGCNVTPIGGGVPTGVSSPLAGAIDSQGGRLFVLGNGSASFSIATDGRLTAISGVPGLNPNGTFTGGVFDPALPNTMYTTSPSFNGVFQGAIDASGGLTMGQGFMQPGAVPTDFALAP